jgi:hypothetical protein
MVRASAVFGIALLCLLTTGCGDGGSSASLDGGVVDVSSDFDATKLDAVVGPGGDTAAPACPQGQERCGDLCTPVQSDPTHCGSCGTNCTTLANVDPGLAVCVGGRCDLTHACRSGFADCDHDTANGCEADLTAPTHCGRCDVTCSGDTSMCAMTATGDGGHEYACSNGCTSLTPTRCGKTCVQTDSDPLHCGSCTGACTMRPNGTVACTAGACATTCNAGFHLCGTSCLSNDSPDSCGAACTPCAAPPANAIATCTGSICGSVCSMGFHRCDTRCVSNMSATSCGASCGACDVPANGRATCDGTTCGVVCNAGFHLCGTECVSNTDLNTCGTSCMPCSGAPNGTASCDGFSCGVTCSSGFHACSGSCLSSSDVGSCGTRCAVCPPGATGTVPVCTAGVCGTACVDGYHRCGDGCLTATSLAGCGMSCSPCQVPANATATCDGTACGYTCRAGFADCDGVATNGCESDLSQSTTCGGCGTNCLAPGPHTVSTCDVSSGVRSCGVRCESGWTDCDSNLANGCEVIGACFTTQTLFTETFETATFPRWSIQLPWHKWLLGMGGYTPIRLGSLTTGGLYTADCRIEGYATMTSDLDVTRATSISLQFDSFTHRGATDGYAIEASTDRGATWTRVFGFFATNVSDWETDSVDLTPFAGASTLRFRYYYLSICPGTQFEWSLDNVIVTARVRTY